MSEATDLAQQLDLSRTRATIGEARHAPGAIYSAPEVLAREKRNIFQKDWLFVCRDEEVPSPGDYLTRDIVGEPIIISRDKQGVLHAFANTCLHRGVEVAIGKGNASRFTCPYHAWTYDSAGRLIGAAHMDEIACFNKAEARLKPLALRVWHGFVMVSLNPEPVDFDEAVRPFESVIAFTHPGECRHATSLMIDLPCNWKFGVENVLDMYHVGTVHAASLGRSFRLDQEGGGIQLGDRGTVCIRFKQKFPTPDGETLFGKLPWLTEADEDKGVAGIFYLAPNFLISAAPDMLRLLSFWPTSPTTTRFEVRMLLPKDKLADPKLDEKLQVYLDYARAVFAEDIGMLGSLQHATVTDLFEPGSFARLETPIHHVVNHLTSRLEA